jgi:hypothetical protein
MEAPGYSEDYRLYKKTPRVPAGLQTSAMVDLGGDTFAHMRYSYTLHILEIISSYQLFNLLTCQPSLRPLCATLCLCALAANSSLLLNLSTCQLLFLLMPVPSPYQHPKMSNEFSTPVFA